jgi:hypothetical protein
MEQCKNELPSTFKAYRFQQHRWSCGPASLFRKVFPQILKNQVRKPPLTHIKEIIYRALVVIFCHLNIVHHPPMVYNNEG